MLAGLGALNGRIRELNKTHLGLGFAGTGNGVASDTRRQLARVFLSKAKKSS